MPRADEFHAWASALGWRFVPLESITTIEGGREGLIHFLRRPGRGAWRSEAFVVVASQLDGYFVLLANEFWREAYPFLHGAQRKRALETASLTRAEARELPSLRRMLSHPEAVAPLIGHLFGLEAAAQSAVLSSIPDASIVPRSRSVVASPGRIHGVVVPAGSVPATRPARDFARVTELTTHVHPRPGGAPRDYRNECVMVTFAGDMLPARCIDSQAVPPDPSPTVVCMQQPPPADELPELRRQLREALHGMPDLPSPASLVDLDLPVPASSPEPDAEIVYRSPHMDLSPAEPVRPGTRLAVSVYLDCQASRAGEDADPLALSWPRGAPTLELQVWLVVTSHFAVAEPAVKALLLERHEARSATVGFEVTVRDSTAAAAGSARISAYFHHNARPCGRVARRVEIAGLGPAGVSDRPETSAVAIDAAARGPDLKIEIADPDRTGSSFSCLLTSPLLADCAAGFAFPWKLKDTTAKALVENCFNLFTAPGKLPSTQRIAALRGAGHRLFAAAPAQFQEAFWRIQEAAAPLRTISVVSEEPYIPWELMIPRRWLADGTRDERNALGVDFAVGRWIRDDHQAARQAVPFKDSWIFAPAYRGPRPPRPLAKAKDEADLVQRLFAGKAITEGGFKELEEALQSGGRSLLHFVCHGVAGPKGAQAIYFQDASQLSAIELEGMKAAELAIGAAKPFVFLNACEVGRTAPALVGVDGFAPTFLQMGASCVVAPLWSVKDDIAHTVAETFYEATRAAPARPFAEILRDIRARAYAGGEDTFAAYCFYGDPCAAQERPAPGPLL